MNETELLTLAAKAAGMEPPFDSLGGLRAWVGSPEGGHWWSPLEDDGDALRLAVKLRITVEQELIETKASAYVLIGTKRQHFVSVSGKVTRQEATRSAIVRAAADIGRTMP
ncbi:hypothetical protein N0619_20160 [Pseudomonas aeruginosa]|nr:hypothetical protein [Pseudomonas aeruginosa]MCT0628127.1 hypothetical protein [Pseudomonas aeruginosa]MCT0669468.1 hypothetical protein [Pseudomonas aeruginosa]HBP5411295.1 hypothetical protein [Pseudomonas aeruginosa]